MSELPDDPNAPVVVFASPDAFAASAAAARLEAAGIPTRVHQPADAMRMVGRPDPSIVAVQASRAEEAAALLAEDPGDVTADFDEMDGPEDDPTRDADAGPAAFDERSVPIAARIAAAITALVLLASILVGLLAAVGVL